MNNGYSHAGIDQEGKEWMERDMRSGSAKHAIECYSSK